MQAPREVWGKTLVELGKEYPELVVLDGDLAMSTRSDIFDAAFPDRFIQTGIAEQNMIGMAAGLSTVGFIPWVSSFAVFLVKRVLDQVRVVIAQPSLNVKLAAAYTGILTSKTGKTHQAVQDIAVMRSMPNMTVIVPADGVELRKAMRVMMETPGPMYLRITRDASPVIFDDSYEFAIGRSVTLREGRDITIIGTGLQTVRALEAAGSLAADGISAHVLHVPTLKPLDEDGICEAAARTGLVVTTEEHTIIGGLGSAVAEVLSERHPVRVKRHGLSDCYGESGPDDALLKKYCLRPQDVSAVARNLLEESRKGG